MNKKIIQSIFSSIIILYFTFISCNYPFNNKSSGSSHHKSSHHDSSSHPSVSPVNGYNRNEILAPLSLITEEDTKNILYYLASNECDGRKTGTIGHENAAAYIATKFEEYGLQKSFGNSYYQTYTRNYISLASLELSVKNHKIVLDPYKDFRLVVNKEKLNIISKLANVQSGDILTGKNTILLFSEELSLSTINKSSILNNIDYSNTDAILLINNSKRNEYNKIISLSYDLNEKSGLPVIQITQEAAKKVFSLLNINNYKGSIHNSNEISYKLDYLTKAGEFKNIVGFLPGNDPNLKNETIVIGAHYDHLGHGYNGADDNASGVTAMLSVAKAFSVIKEKLKRNIVFVAFDSEEIDFSGSAYYANNPVLPESKMVFMCNIDMVGRLNNTLMNLNITSNDYAPIVDKIKGYYTFNFLLNTSIVADSDHISFSMPKVFLHTGLHSDYHTTNDNPDRINYPGLVEISEFIFEMIWYYNFYIIQIQ